MNLSKIYLQMTESITSVSESTINKETIEERYNKVSAELSLISNI